MKRAAAVLLVLTLAPTVSACAARQAFLERVSAKKQGRVGSTAVSPGTARMLDGQRVQVTNLTALPAPDGSVPASAIAATGTSTAPSIGAVSPGMQFLYGSGEAEALSMQAFLRLADLMIAKSTDRTVGLPISSVVLAPGSTLDAPKYLPCGDKPLAAVFDIDETALLNLGYEADDSQRRAPYDQARWNRWEQTGQNAVVATPGMAEVARVAKAANVTLVFNSNRMAANAAQTEAALSGAGLGPVAHGKNLWLQGDESTGSGKDARRTAIAQKFCVIAMAGDQLGDFSDLFNAPGLTPAERRALAGGTQIKVLWGHGWFILPNPVYGTALKGNLDDVFPAGKRWTDPSPAGAQ